MRIRPTREEVVFTRDNRGDPLSTQHAPHRGDGSGLYSRKSMEIRSGGSCYSHHARIRRNTQHRSKPQFDKRLASVYTVNSVIQLVHPARIYSGDVVFNLFHPLHPVDACQSGLRVCWCGYIVLQRVRLSGKRRRLALSSSTAASSKEHQVPRKPPKHQDAWDRVQVIRAVM